PRVEVEQLDGHLADGRTRLLALLAPALSSQLVQSRRRAVLRDIGCGAIPLELIDAIQRDIEAVAPLVFDDGDLDGALADEDRHDAAVDADAVLEVHDVVTLAQRQRLGGDAARIPARASDAPLAPEDLVIGEDTETAPVRRNEEPALQHSDGQRRRRRNA